MTIGRRSRSNVSKSRPVVFRRDGRECVVAGLWESVKWPCAGGLTVQHRRGRGMGGSAVWDEPDCLVAMCVGICGLRILHIRLRISVLSRFVMSVLFVRSVWRMRWCIICSLVCGVV